MKREITSEFEPEEPIEELGWPKAFSPDGRYAIYEKSDDIVLLELRSAEIIPVAATDAKEPNHIAG